ncbi:Nucleoside phosphorylase domain protein [Candidatus Omnitrophus magneticus]|uniref:Uridine phosphorylase n=1 Tax=Candidatus Omnitrophus magneticus TaxID=1609969 RepID=A0A0F0CU80_9BACT|nr:Nucleoside phosphorylase domain protein [Candidatus Omnitrophus magneticus]
MNYKLLIKFLFGLEMDAIPSKAIVTPFFPLKYFKGHGEKIHKEFNGRLYSGFIAEKNNIFFIVVYCGIGDRLLGDAVILLAKAGVKEVLFIGTCGGLGEVMLGDLLIPVKAFNGEGFSIYYRKNFSMEKLFEYSDNSNSDKSYIGNITQFVQKNYKGTRFIRSEVSIFTIGALSIETKENLTAIYSRGYIGIEMELSAVYSAADVSGIKAGAILVVSDLPLINGVGQELDDNEKIIFKDSLKNIAFLAIEFISS